MKRLADTESKHQINTMLDYLSIYTAKFPLYKDMTVALIIMTEGGAHLAMKDGPRGEHSIALSFYVTPVAHNAAHFKIIIMTAF